MQTVKFNNDYIVTKNNYIAIGKTERDAQINLMQIVPKPELKRRTLEEIISSAKRARQSARLVNFF